MWDYPGLSTSTRLIHVYTILSVPCQVVKYRRPCQPVPANPPNNPTTCWQLLHQHTFTDKSHWRLLPLYFGNCIAVAFRRLYVVSTHTVLQCLSYVCIASTHSVLYSNFSRCAIPWDLTDFELDLHSLLFSVSIITADEWSCGKVMFSYVSVRQSVILSTGSGSPCDYPPPPQLEDPLTPSPLVLTSGGHQSTYSWQAGGTHPTGMLSSSIKYSNTSKGHHYL